MRGRLIRPFLVEIARLDTVATAADPDGAGTRTSGYDDVFREPVMVSNATGLGTTARAEMDLVRVRAQIETGTFQDQQPTQNGNESYSKFNLVMHLQELEAEGYVDVSSGMVLFKPGDRINAIYDLRGVLVQTLPNPPGLFISEVMPASYGLGINRNLVVIKCASRKQGQ